MILLGTRITESCCKGGRRSIFWKSVFSIGNRTLQTELSARNQYVQLSLQLEPLYQGVIRNLVELAAKNNDGQIRDLLVSQGITFKVNAPDNLESAGKNADRPVKP